MHSVTSRAFTSTGKQSLWPWLQHDLCVPACVMCDMDIYAIDSILCKPVWNSENTHSIHRYAMAAALEDYSSMTLTDTLRLTNSFWCKTTQKSMREMWFLDIVSWSLSIALDPSWEFLFKTSTSCSSCHLRSLMREHLFWEHYSISV